MIPVDGRDRFHISHHRLAMARLVTAPPRHYARGNAIPARSTRSRNDHVVCPARPTTLCACHSELMMLPRLFIRRMHSSMWVCSHQKNSTTAMSQSLGYICAIVSPMIRMPVSMSAASGRTKLRRIWESSISSTSNTLPGMNVTPWERQDSNTSRERTRPAKKPKYSSRLQARSNTLHPAHTAPMLRLLHLVECGKP